MDGVSSLPLTSEATPSDVIYDIMAEKDMEVGEVLGS